MATADGIQIFAETIVPKTTNEIEDQQYDAIRQYLSKKTAWVSPNEEQFDTLIAFLKKRLDEGHGETILEIGAGGNLLTLNNQLIKYFSRRWRITRFTRR